MFDKLYDMYKVDDALSKVSSISLQLNNLLAITVNDIQTPTEKDLAIDCLVEILMLHKSKKHIITRCC